MVARVQEARIGTNNTPPADGSLLPGQFYLEMGTPTRLWVGVPTSIVASGVKLLMDVDANSAALGSLAPKASPVFTGDPQAPTPATPDNDTTVATTAFVKAQGYQTAAQVTPAWNNAGRNLVHNSLFNVAQRGAGPFSASGYTLDRWAALAVGDTISFTQNAANDANRAAIGDEAATQLLTNIFTGTAGAGSLNFIAQNIENVRRLGGKTVTISFWAVASVALKLGVNVQQLFGSGGSPSGSVWALTTGASFNLTTTWARYSTTIAIPSTTGKTLGTNGTDCTQVALWYSCGATNNAVAGNIGVQSGTIQIWGVQLEIGSVMTPLEKPDPQQDLAKCQRFYQTGVIGAVGYNLAGGSVGGFAPFPVVMRAPPTIILLSTLTSVNASAVLTDTPTKEGFRVVYTAAATGTLQGTNVYSASAEL